jgi:hypothetical protein
MPRTSDEFTVSPGAWLIVLIHSGIPTPDFICTVYGLLLGENNLTSDCHRRAGKNVPVQTGVSRYLGSGTGILCWSAACHRSFSFTCDLPPLPIVWAKDEILIYIEKVNFWKYCSFKELFRKLLNMVAVHIWRP